MPNHAFVETPTRSPYKSLVAKNCTTVEENIVLKFLFQQDPILRRTKFVKIQKPKF